MLKRSSKAFSLSGVCMGVHGGGGLEGHGVEWMVGWGGSVLFVSVLLVKIGDYALGVAYDLSVVNDDRHAVLARDLDELGP